MIFKSDIRYAARLLAKNPGFAMLTTLVMAAGIGLSVYMFSILNIFIYKDLPLEDGDTLISLHASLNGNRSFGRFDPFDYYEIRDQVKGLSEMSAYDTISVSVAGRDGATRYKGVAAEANFFRMSRVKPILGREFAPAETQAGAERVTVIGYDLWQKRYHGSPQALDQTMRIDGVNHRVIGVMPEGYFFPNNAEFWVAMQPTLTHLTRSDEGRDVRVLAHLADGYSMDDIDRQLTLIMQRLEERYPDTNSGIGAYTQKLQGQPTNVFIFSIQLSAILILILASLNVSNLLFSRAIERGKETAIRAALGAPRSRLIGQMLWESIIICSVGGSIGLAGIVWGLKVTETIFTSRFIADRPPFWWDFGLDGFTIGLFLFVLTITIFITGVLPAWKNSSTNFNSVLRDGTRGALGKKAGRLSRLLVVGEVFIAITVLITAGNLIVASYQLMHADIGADIENKFIGKVSMSNNDLKYNSEQKRAQFAKVLQAHLENSAGIGDVIIAESLPGDGARTAKIAIDGKEYTSESRYPRANNVTIMPGSLAKLGIKLVEGRYFNSSDNGLDKRTIIVTDSFAQRRFKNESALGKRVRFVGEGDAEPEWLTIVGVVKHVVFGGTFSEQSRLGAIFRPYTQAAANDFHVVMQMKADRSVVLKTLRKKLASIDPELAAFRFETYTERLKRYSGGLGFISNLFLLLGIATLLLASSGIYGVTSNTINQRTQEIGVKRALGAVEKRITKEYLIIGLKQLLWGGIPGCLIGSGVGFALSAQMGIGIVDLLFVSIPLMLIIASVVLYSTWLPTQRALQIDPSEALRYE